MHALPSRLVEKYRHEIMCHVCSWYLEFQRLSYLHCLSRRLLQSGWFQRVCNLPGREVEHFWIQPL